MNNLVFPSVDFNSLYSSETENLPSHGLINLSKLSANDLFVSARENVNCEFLDDYALVSRNDNLPSWWDENANRLYLHKKVVTGIPSIVVHPNLPPP